MDIMPTGVLPPQRLVSKAGKMRNFVFERERFGLCLMAGRLPTCLGVIAGARAFEVSLLGLRLFGDQFGQHTGEIIQYHMEEQEGEW